MLIDNSLRDKDKVVLAEELGIHMVDLERLKYHIYYLYDEDDEHVGYKMELLGDNPQEVVTKILDLQDNVIILPLSLFTQLDREWYEYQFDPIIEYDDNLQIFYNEIDNLLKLSKVAWAVSN